jgi:hypothetical protein
MRRDSQEENLSNNNDKSTRKKNDRNCKKQKKELGNDYNISVFENLKRLKKINYRIKEDVKAAKAKVLEDIRK